MKGPNLFLLGAAKSGTTALSGFLGEHPNIYIGYPKEPSYWSFDISSSNSVCKIDSLSEYLSVYEGSSGERYILDASTSYLYSREAVTNIVNFCREAKFIVVIRDLVEMAHAYHMEKVFNASEDEEDFEKAWHLQYERLRGRNIPKRCAEPAELQYKAIVSVGTQLERVLSVVADSSVLICFHDDFKNDPRAFWGEIMSFLQIEDAERTDYPTVGGAHYNRFQRLAFFYQQPPHAIAPVIYKIKKFFRNNVFGRTVWGALRGVIISTGERVPLDADFKNYLRGELEPEVEKIERITGRDLSHWKV